MSSPMFRLLAAATIVVSATAAQAAPFSFTFSGTVTSVGPGLTGIVTDGDAVSVVVIMDNGGTDTASQNWAVTDTVSATLNAGSYTATWTNDFFTNLFATGFDTDALGNLTLTQWLGTFFSPSAVDSFGSGATLASNGVATSNSEFFVFSPGFAEVGAWSGPVAVPTPIPLPASGVLIGGALLLLAGLGRRRAA